MKYILYGALLLYQYSTAAAVPGYGHTSEVLYTHCCYSSIFQKYILIGRKTNSFLLWVVAAFLHVF